MYEEEEERGYGFCDEGETVEVGVDIILRERTALGRRSFENVTKPTCRNW